MDVWYLFHYHSFNCIQGQNLICIFLEQFWPFFRARQWKFAMTFWVLPQLLSVVLSQNYTFFNASIVKDSTKNHSIPNRLERCQHLYAMTEYILGSSSLNFPKSPQANNIIPSIPSKMNLMLSTENKAHWDAECSKALSSKRVYYAWRLTHFKKNKKDSISIFFRNQRLAWNAKNMRFTYKSKRLLSEWIQFYANEISEFPLSHSFSSAEPKVNCL